MGMGKYSPTLALYNEKMFDTLFDDMGVDKEGYDSYGYLAVEPFTDRAGYKEEEYYNNEDLYDEVDRLYTFINHAKFKEFLRQKLTIYYGFPCDN